MEKHRLIERKRDYIDKFDLSIMKSASVCVEKCAQFSLSAVTDRFTHLIFQRSAREETCRRRGRFGGAAPWLVLLWMQS